MSEPSSVEDLNQQFAIPGVAEIVGGHNGLPKVRITLPAASADIYLHGAQVTSFKPAGAEDAIFLSEHSSFEHGKAIRGGIPVCFPWFRNKLDDPKAPSHGFVRTKAWELQEFSYNHDTVTATFTTGSDASTKAWFPSDFLLTYRITVGAELKLELIMSNLDTKPLRFEEALHTYHLVGDARKVSVSGIDGVDYLDNTDNNKEKRQQGDLHFTKATDSVFLNTTHTLDLVDPTLKRRIQIEKQHSNTTVIWNPWQEGAKTLADLGDDEWQQMTCVEASNIRACGVELAAGAVHTMTAIIRVIPGE
jgi:glucose-6-phosphate 1-epimerase